MKLTKKTKQPRISIQKLRPIGKAFQAGGNEVLNNPEKYGLLAVPTDQEIQNWIVNVQASARQFEHISEYDIGLLIFTVRNAFEYFKNRKA